MHKFLLWLPVSGSFNQLVCLSDGREAPDEDSSESEAEEATVSQECKTQAPNSQPGSGSHKPSRTSLEDSGRWSDSLSVDEKDGFVFVNYSEGQARPANPPANNPHNNPQALPPQPLQPGNIEPRAYNKLRAGINMKFILIRYIFILHN